MIFRPFDQHSDVNMSMIFRLFDQHSDVNSPKILVRTLQYLIMGEFSVFVIIVRILIYILTEPDKEKVPHEVTSVYPTVNTLSTLIPTVTHFELILNGDHAKKIRPEVSFTNNIGDYLPGEKIHAKPTNARYGVLRKGTYVNLRSDQDHCWITDNNIVVWYHPIPTTNVLVSYFSFVRKSVSFAFHSLCSFVRDSLLSFAFSGLISAAYHKKSPTNVCYEIPPEVKCVYAEVRLISNDLKKDISHSRYAELNIFDADFLESALVCASDKDFEAFLQDADPTDMPQNIEYGILRKGTHIFTIHEKRGLASEKITHRDIYVRYELPVKSLQKNS
jgi:hypothetical protein